MNEPRFLDFNLSKNIVKHLRLKEKNLLAKENIFISIARWCLTALFFYAYYLFFKDAKNILMIFAGILPALPLGFGFGKGLGRLIFKIFFHLMMNKEADYKNYKSFEYAKKNYLSDYKKEKRKFWQNLSGNRFENEIAHLLKKAGYKIRITRTSDSDPVAFWIGTETIVHCNAFNTPITENEIKQFNIALNYSDATKAIIISKSGFSSNGYKAAENTPIRLWDLNQVLNLQLKFDS